LNRYGLSQAITIKAWPILKPILIGSLRMYRGIPVDVLGQAIANNLFSEGKSFEIFQWDEFYTLMNETG